MKKGKTAWAFALYGRDDDSYMLGEEKCESDRQTGQWRFGSLGQPHPATCPQCGGKTDAGYVGPDYRVKKRRRDITTTYDGYTLVSERLRNVLQEGGANRDDFVALPADAEFYWLRPQATLEYSAAERAKPCPSCGQFIDEVVPVPLFLGNLVAPISSGVYRSSLEFGSAPLKAFQIVVGQHVASALQEGSFVGIELEKLQRS